MGNGMAGRSCLWVGRCPGIWGVGFEREGMNGFTGHGTVDGTVYELVLLNQGLAFKRCRNHGDLEVVAAAGEVLNLDLGVGELGLNHRFDFFGPDHGFGFRPLDGGDGSPIVRRGSSQRNP